MFGPLSERMGVRAPNGGELLVSDEEMEAASKFHVLCILLAPERLLLHFFYRTLMKARSPRTTLICLLQVSTMLSVSIRSKLDTRMPAT